MSSILHYFPPSVRGMLYVDDLQISCQGSDMQLIERQLQTTVNRLVKWCDRNGHTISPSKSSFVHFSRKRNLHLDSLIHIGDIQIPVVKTETRSLTTPDKFNALSTETLPESVPTTSNSEHSYAPEIPQCVKRNSQEIEESAQKWVVGVSPLLSIGWWYLSSESPKRHCCRISAADKGCRVYPLDPRPDAVALCSGCTSGKRRA
ncbi:putative RNA-directed DNA polymerase from transposon X-element [Trichonephila clavipes]|nr:putative RNA-directed DNA polymerase from transposon X-element [Trichonephila clavipes]